MMNFTFTNIEHANGELLTPSAEFSISELEVDDGSPSSNYISVESRRNSIIQATKEQEVSQKSAVDVADWMMRCVAALRNTLFN